MSNLFAGLVSWQNVSFVFAECGYFDGTVPTGCQGRAKVQIWISNLSFYVGIPCKYTALVVRIVFESAKWKKFNWNMQKESLTHLLWACSFLPWVSAWVLTWASRPWRGWIPWPLLAHAQALPISGGHYCTDAGGASSWPFSGSQDLKQRVRL